MNLNTISLDFTETFATTPMKISLSRHAHALSCLRTLQKSVRAHANSHPRDNCMAAWGHGLKFGRVMRGKVELS